MHLLISNTGELILEDIDNMKGFSIIDESENSNLTNLLAISTPAEENHYWLDADAVIAAFIKSGRLKLGEGILEHARSGRKIRVFRHAKKNASKRILTSAISSIAN